MSTILTISSHVIRGHVGNSAALFILQRLGHTVWPFHTVYLSNHPGYRLFSGEQLSPQLLYKKFDMLQKNSWLHNIDAILTGYLPHENHIAFAIHVIKTIKQLKPSTIILCDPTLGDYPKGLYIDKPAAEKIKMDLVQFADVITPNRFELEWLSARSIETSQAVKEACQTLNIKTILTTSAPSEKPKHIDNHLWQNNSSSTRSHLKRANIPHGTGDSFAALFLGFLLKTQDKIKALHLATEAMEHILSASENKDELELIQTQGLWANVD